MILRTKTVTIRPEAGDRRYMDRTDPAPVRPLTAEQLKALYHDPEAIVPDHTLDDLVQGMKRFYGFKTQ